MFGCWTSKMTEITIGLGIPRISKSKKSEQSNSFDGFQMKLEMLQFKHIFVEICHNQSILYVYILSNLTVYYLKREWLRRTNLHDHPRQQRQRCQTTHHPRWAKQSESLPCNHAILNASAQAPRFFFQVHQSMDFKPVHWETVCVYTQVIVI